MKDMCTDNNVILSDNLSRLMKSFKINQKQLAQELSIHPMSLCKWINGAAYPTTESLNKVADYFGVSIDALTRKKDSVDQEIEMMLSVLSPTEKIKILEIMKIILK